MTTAIEHLASLTIHRDRDLLDVTLAHAMRDLFCPAEVAIHMLVGPPGGAQRWLLRARLKAGDVAATSDPSWVTLEDLPLRHERPAHAACIEQQAIIRCDGPDGGASACTVLFPLTVQAEQPMVMELRCTQPFGDEARHTADNILRVYRNFCGLIDYSERDTLTGLLNRKTFDEAFYKLTQGIHTVFDTASGRRQQATPPEDRRTGHWLGVLDIDHFKRVNDLHGHLIGDEVLLLVGRILRSTFRFQDRLYRFGGEEFVAVLRCPSEAHAQSAFERLRRNMAGYPFPKVGTVTVSVGFTEVLPHDTPTAAFERADKAVYHAKQHGRDQVCSHAALVACGALAPQQQESEVELF
ncbi:MAG: GGDEF domain-containing protein [Pseudomonadota bacterium]